MNLVDNARSLHDGTATAEGVATSGGRWLAEVDINRTGALTKQPGS